MSRLADQVEAYTKHGVVPVKWADPEPLPNIPDPHRAEVARLTQALGECAIALDCMSGLTSRNECHRERAREVITAALSWQNISAQTRSGESPSA